MQGVTLNFSWLQGATFEGARLQSSNLTGRTYKVQP
ncbi:pentapeptide repeat-containing protein [Reyranella soli]